MKYVKQIPLSSIEKISIVVTKCKKSLSQTKKYTNATYLLNGGMWNGDGSPCRGLKVDGKLLSATPYGDLAGYGWNSVKDISQTTKWSNFSNYICTSPLIVDGEKLSKIPYDSAQGGSRPRSAIGLTDSAFVMYCSSDSRTPEQVRDELYKIGCKSAMMLDSGGSTQCDFDGQKIKASRLVHNWIAVWVNKDDETDISESEDVLGTYRVTPSIGVNIRSGAGSSYSKVGAYACGTIVTVQSISNGWGKTSKGWVSMDYLELVSEKQRVTDNGVKIQTHYITNGRKNRPGGSNPDKWITIHETGNYASSADASAHGNYLNSDAAVKDMSSWHYTVDDHSIVQHLPDNEQAYHAGDGANGPGNTTSIGIEICVNDGGNFEKAKINAASLVRLLMKEHNIPIENIVQHNKWNGKDCPKTIRATPGGWDAFIKLCKGETSEKTQLELDVDLLADEKILTAVDYWKGDTYSTSNVHSLIHSMAEYVRSIV